MHLIRVILQRSNPPAFRSSKTPPFQQLRNAFSCFDGLSTNGKSSTISIPGPFALSLSKGERRIFQQLVSISIFHYSITPFSYL